MSAQKVKGLIEVGILGFSGHGHFPVCEDVKREIGKFLANLKLALSISHIQNENRNLLWKQSRPKQYPDRRCPTASGGRRSFAWSNQYATFRASRCWARQSGPTRAGA